MNVTPRPPMNVTLCKTCNHPKTPYPHCQAIIHVNADLEDGGLPLYSVPCPCTLAE